MSLSFLNPLFWLGVLAVAAPVYLHLRRKQPSNLFHFSALRFLEDQPEPRQAPLHLRDLLLFILRVMALLLLVGAFAWPYLRNATHVVVKESRVYILDNSLSHQVDGGFQKDRDRVSAELAGLGKDVQIGVIELTANPRVLVGFGEDRETARQKVRELQPSFQRGSYYAAFRQAGVLLGNSLGETRKIVLLGDNQENQWADNVNSPPFLEDVEVKIPSASGTPRANVAVFEPRAQRVFLGDRVLVNFTAQVSRQGGIRFGKLVLRINGQEALSREIDLADRPENFTFQTEWEAEPSIPLDCELSIQAEGDALAGDNRTFFSLPAAKEGTVAVLAQSHFLKLALSPEVMRGHWAARFIDPARISSEIEAGDDAEVLCIESSYLQSSEARKLLSRYLGAGRGVFLMVNRVSPSTRGFLKELGFEVLSSDTSKAGLAHFQYIFANHPILHPFTSPDFGNLLEIQVTDPIRLRGSQARSLIFTDKGDSVLFQTTKPGRLLVQAFGFDRAQTSWPVHPTFLPFLDLCLQNARPVDSAQTVFEPAEVFTQNFATNSGVRAVVLKSGKELARAAVVNGKAQLRLPDQPGFYKVACEGGAVSERTLCVNPSPRESQLVYNGAPQALQGWQMPQTSKGRPIAEAKTKGSATLAAISQERIWWWLLLGAVAGLYCETWWTILKRRIP